MQARLSPEEALGKKYGKLIATKIAGSDKHRQTLVVCICDCGNEKIVMLRLLRNGHVKSCGCLKKESNRRNVQFLIDSCITNGVWKDPKIGSAKEVFRMRYSDGDLSFDDFFQLSQTDCHYCGRSPSNKYNAYKAADGSPRVKGLTQTRIDGGDFFYNGLDRVDNNGGHTKDNVVPCCADCNYAKLDRSRDEFLEWIKIVYKKNFA